MNAHIHCPNPSRSLVNDDFFCKVTLDIVTSGYENMNYIEDILHNHITNIGRLGNTSVSDRDFSANVIDPGLEPLSISLLKIT